LRSAPTGQLADGGEGVYASKHGIDDRQPVALGAVEVVQSFMVLGWGGDEQVGAPGEGMGEDHNPKKLLLW